MLGLHWMFPQIDENVGCNSALVTSTILPCGEIIEYVFCVCEIIYLYLYVSKQETYFMHFSNISFVYGLCVMFYTMMIWLFWRRGNDRLSRLIVVLMTILDAECLKDILLPGNWLSDYSYYWFLTSAIDMLIIPFYIFILMELVKPGWLTWRRVCVHELGFVGLILAFAFTGVKIWFELLTMWSAIYGTATYILTFFFISRYHRQLKERFSYQDNINLNWLRGILFCCFFILVFWVVSCYVTDISFDMVYMLCSLICWMAICYFLYKHESVIDELGETDMVTSKQIEKEILPTGNSTMIRDTVNRLFIEEKLYLNPRLKLSDVARLVGTNRTYISRFFNQENGQTFYDYVNNLRIKYAENLLRSSTRPLSVIAQESGFNSLSTFRRVFSQVHGCSPIEYRNQQNK